LAKRLPAIYRDLSLRLHPIEWPSHPAGCHYFEQRGFTGLRLHAFLVFALIFAGKYDASKAEKE